MAQSIVMPSFGMYTSEGKLVTWLKQSGAKVEAGQIIAEIETEKAVQELPAIATGILHHVAAVGTMLKEEALLGYILADGETPPGAAPALADASAPAAATSPPARAGEVSHPLTASPIAKRLAKEHGIDLSRLQGTGPRGRIVESDVTAAIAQKQTAPDWSSTQLRREPLASMRRTIAERLRAPAERRNMAGLTCGVIMSTTQPFRLPISSAELALRIRRHVVVMTHRANASHIGSCLSMADVLAVLYARTLRYDPKTPDWADRDRFILSKGHGCAALYAVLAECGFFPLEWLETYCLDGTRLAGHATHKGTPGVELSTGSLGHGLPVASGMALAAKRDGRAHRAVVVLSDGECDEGSNWEAALFAPHHKLDNLTVIIDYNKIQSLGNVKDVIDLDPLADKWRAFGWATRELDGHDIGALESALTQLPFEAGRPSCIVAHTIKGKGVSFMENKLQYHYTPPRGDELPRALKELEGCP